MLKPNPHTESNCRDPGGPAVRPDRQALSGLKGSEQFLKTGDLSDLSDLGAYATYDETSSSGSTGDLPMDNGCDYKDVNPLVKAGRMALTPRPRPAERQ